VVKFLIEKGAEVYHVDGENMSTLMLATSFLQNQIFNYLLEFKAKVQFT
jgi:hypothetical protein